MHATSSDRASESVAELLCLHFVLCCHITAIEIPSTYFLHDLSGGTDRSSDRSSSDLLNTLNWWSRSCTTSRRTLLAIVLLFHLSGNALRILNMMEKRHKTRSQSIIICYQRPAALNQLSRAKSVAWSRDLHKRMNASDATIAFQRVDWLLPLDKTNLGTIARLAHNASLRSEGRDRFA